MWVVQKKFVGPASAPPAPADGVAGRRGPRFNSAMPRVSFTANLRRHVDCPDTDAPGGTVREALDAVFAQRPQLRGYVLDDQGAVRRHVTIFLDGAPIIDRTALSDAVRPDSELYVMQALSGG